MQAQLFKGKPKGDLLGAPHAIRKVPSAPSFPPFQFASLSQQHQRRSQKCSTRAFNLFRGLDDLRKKSVVDVSKEFNLDGGLVATSIPRISLIEADEWNSLVQAQEEYNPFVSYEFLSALEASGSVSPAEGWMPQHLLLRESGSNGKKGKLLGAVPLYLKSHSYGEYVFDSSWARYAMMMDINYYPKLQGCVPFSPVPGPRLLTLKDQSDAQGKAATQKALATALIQLMDALKASSVHLTFNSREEAELLEECGFMSRIGMQFHWENDNFKNFDDFLLALKQSKRKSVKQERKSHIAQGLRIRRLSGDALRAAGPQIWDRFYTFYEDTIDRNWGSAYLKPEFFPMLGDKMADQVLLVVAEEEKDGAWQMVAGSLNLIGSHALFGRNWGQRPGIEFKNLHFELCYYQAIDEAIARNLPRVEAGAQGQHKLQRGYLPNLTYSSHYFNQPLLKKAVAQFLEKDRAYIAAACASLAMQASPFKSERTGALVSAKLKTLANHVRGTGLEMAFNSISEELDEDR
uniref:Uncharacterized protein n=1 Tax=Dunaliella tertiolecta TaxID=3047 RepID=A0A7S3VR85_DUNTE|mmetsp:Transcript_21467/g.59457  ORF Transcript_21467/g.59457 Transcript_21467/m.59457 type:complete len:518 (+) Transcript_21467:67-1620(+)